MSRGSYPVTLKTINGSFAFGVRRYETSAGSSNWLRLSDPALSAHHESPSLQAFAVYYATRLSYERVSELVGERSGTSRLSDQRIQQLVQGQADQLTQAQAAQLAAQPEAAQQVQATAVDVYDAAATEVVWLADGVCVSEQKAVRDKQPKAGKERTTTDLAMLQKPDGSYQTIIAGAGIDAVHLYQTEVLRAYGQAAAQLPVVAISDGARSIKKEVQQVFGAQVTHILDWYHLEAKTLQMMTMIAPNKAAKEVSNKLLLEALWHGQTAQALTHLRSLGPKNAAKWQELIGYLQKNQTSIIDYDQRQQAGKVIGSGRMEKQNDVLVAQRQKRKGMSWSKQGSLSLALVTAHLPSLAVARTAYLQ